MEVQVYDVAGWISEEEAAAIRTAIDRIEVCKGTIGKWVRDGYIQSFKINGAKFVSQMQVIEFKRPKLGRRTAEAVLPRIMPPLPKVIELTFVLRMAGIDSLRIQGEPLVAYKRYDGDSLQQVPSNFKPSEYLLDGWAPYREARKIAPVGEVSKDLMLDRMKSHEVQAFKLHKPFGNAFVRVKDVKGIKWAKRGKRPKGEPLPEFEPLPSIMRISAKIVKK